MCCWQWLENLDVLGSIVISVGGNWMECKTFVSTLDLILTFLPLPLYLSVMWINALSPPAHLHLSLGWIEVWFLGKLSAPSHPTWREAPRTADLKLKTHASWHCGWKLWRRWSMDPGLKVFGQVCWHGWRFVCFQGWSTDWDIMITSKLF